jgi:hypothetical protein
MPKSCNLSIIIENKLTFFWFRLGFFKLRQNFTRLLGFQISKEVPRDTFKKDDSLSKATFSLQIPDFHLDENHTVWQSEFNFSQLLPNASKKQELTINWHFCFYYHRSIFRQHAILTLDF